MADITPSVTATPSVGESYEPKESDSMSKRCLLLSVLAVVFAFGAGFGLGQRLTRGPSYPNLFPGEEPMVGVWRLVNRSLPDAHIRWTLASDRSAAFQSMTEDGRPMVLDSSGATEVVGDWWRMEDQLFIQDYHRPHMFKVVTEDQSSMQLALMDSEQTFDLVRVK